MSTKSIKASPKSMMIMIAVIVVIGITIALLVTRTPGNYEDIALKQGQSYDITSTGSGTFQVIDDTGNTIELKRINSEVYQDSQGRKYKFVSGSPFKYMGKP